MWLRGSRPKAGAQDALATMYYEDKIDPSSSTLYNQLIQKKSPIEYKGRLWELQKDDPVGINQPIFGQSGPYAIYRRVPKIYDLSDKNLVARFNNIPNFVGINTYSTQNTWIGSTLKALGVLGILGGIYYNYYGTELPESVQKYGSQSIESMKKIYQDYQRTPISK